MGLLDERVHDEGLAVVQVPGDADVPRAVGVLERVEQILGLIVRLQVLLIIIALIGLGRHQRRLQALPVLLLDLDLCSRIHLLVALVKLLILVQHDPVLVCHRQHLLDARWQLFSVIGLLLG